MRDARGREIDYIRISVTDRCNLRCIYCMPEEGICLTAHEEILSFDEIERLCTILSSLGIRKVKLTGGEPLVRKGIIELVGRIKVIPGIENVTLTTNGVLLEGMIEDLAAAGIDGINVSLDTMNPDIFAQITRSNMFTHVIQGLYSVLKYPNIILKINCVPLGLKEQDLEKLALLAKDHNIHVRFIEMMPIGYGKNYKPLKEKEIVEILQDRVGPLTNYEKSLGNGPGHYYKAAEFVGKIGFISAISHQFCETCNRIRLSAIGYLKTCLQYDKGRDLKELLRNGCTDQEIKEEIIEAIMEKPIAHSFLSTNIESEEQHTMSQIGG